MVIYEKSYQIRNTPIFVDNNIYIYTVKKCYPKAH